VVGYNPPPVSPPHQPQPPRLPSPSRRERFFASRYWLILKNLIGWPLILLSFVAGPLVPGPGGIPLFLIGFALVSFPGKRRLTARVLRGRPVRFRRRPFVLVSLAAAVGASALLIRVGRARSDWLERQYARGTLPLLLLYLIAAAVVWLIARYTPHVLNCLLRVVARGRRRFRPWLRRHRIRLLPPRRRRRHPHEAGSGPFRLTDEILKFTRRQR